MSRWPAAVILLFLSWFCFFPRPFSKAATSQPLAFLTFDDGPSPESTGRILDELRQAQVPATFFVTGRHARAYPDLVRRMVREGHEVENHSLTHPHLVLHMPSFVRKELDETNAIISRLTGNKPRFFRPPYGQYHRGIARIAAGLGLTLTLWSCTSYDWRNPGTDRITRNVIEGLKPGTIILLHDGGGDRLQTVEAVPKIIREGREHGFHFLRLADLRFYLRGVK